VNDIRILLSGKINLQHYVDAVNGVGADADAKYLPDIDTSYDGLILCGGNDIDPSRYNESVDGAIEIDRLRDQVEFDLLRAYIDAGKPVMGICRGFQLINVFFGGSLYQDLPDKSSHTSQTDHYITHSVTATENSIVGKIYGTSFPVNSSHHQAVKVLGEGLNATAYWKDKYVEAFEHKTLPIFGIQWHPEKMCFGHKRDDTVDGAELFKQFAAMCKK